MRKRKYPESDTLVALLKEKRDLTFLRDEGWYRIPVKSTPKELQQIKYLAFYQPGVFGEEKWRVQYYGPIERMDRVKRIDLFPKEQSHVRRDAFYYRIKVAEVERLPKPILSKRGRRILFIPTTFHKLCNAEEINDLFHDSPLEDDLWIRFKKEQIEVERQYYVKEETGPYCLDFALFCREGKINVECNGYTYHGRDRADSDRERNNILQSKGWQVLRFSTGQLENMQECLERIKKTINQYGGLLTTEEQTRWFETVESDGTTQLELFR